MRARFAAFAFSLAALLSLPDLVQADVTTTRKAHSVTTPKSPSTRGRVHVRGYRRKDGTYVAPHTRAAPYTRGTPKKRRSK